MILWFFILFAAAWGQSLSLLGTQSINAGIPAQAPLKAPSCPQSTDERPGAPVDAKTRENFAAVAEEVGNATGVEEPMQIGINNLNFCFSEESRKKIGTVGMIAEIRKKLNRSKLPPTRKDDGTLATSEDWLNVDLLTRTLIGEISSTPGCGLSYVRAVGRVILNRRDFVQNDTTQEWKKFATSQQKNLFVNMLMKKGQFDALKPTDPANRWFACPATHIKQSYHFQKKVSTGQSEYMNWFNAQDVAMDIIFHQKKFRDDTQNVKALYYSTGEAVDKLRRNQNFKLVNDAEVNGEVINNVRCIHLWDPPPPETKKSQ